MTRLLAAIAVVALIGGTSPAAHAQSTFPNRLITLIVPFPAGGTADLLCRLAADRAGALLGQQMVVENKPGGAGGRIGIEQVLRHINRRAAFHSEDEYRLADRRPLARTGDWTSHPEVRDAASAIQSTERLVRIATGKPCSPNSSSISACTASPTGSIAWTANR